MAEAGLRRLRIKMQIKVLEFTRSCRMTPGRHACGNITKPGSLRSLQNGALALLGWNYQFTAAFEKQKKARGLRYISAACAFSAINRPYIGNRTVPHAIFKIVQQVTSSMRLVMFGWKPNVSFRRGEVGGKKRSIGWIKRRLKIDATKATRKIFNMNM